MSIIKSTINKINPGQMPVDACDEPVYALTKEIQWRYPTKFGSDQYFSWFGELHVEKRLLEIHSQLIDGNDLREILKSYCLSIAGSGAVFNMNQ